MKYQNNPRNIKGNIQRLFENDQNDNADTSANCQKNFNDDFFNSLPNLLRDITVPLNSIDEKLITLLGATTLIGSFMPNVYGKYDSKKLYPNLYLYVYGKAGSGKGVLTWLLDLLKPVQRHYTQINERHIHLIPAHNSSAGFVQLLRRNGETGLMFETEGDTITNSIMKDFGDYSDIWRKAFHHEQILKYTKGNEEYISLECPKISTILSSTPIQLVNLLKDAENGLVSRFMFYITQSDDSFKDVFGSGSGADLDELFDITGEKLVSYLTELAKCQKIMFNLSIDQQKYFLNYFNITKTISGNSLSNNDMDASVNRMGCIFFRIATVFSLLRAFEENRLSSNMVCTQIDFDNTRKLIDLLLENAAKTIQLLESNQDVDLVKNARIFYDVLPDEFLTREAIEIGKLYNMAERKINRLLSKSNLFEKIEHGKYSKKIKSKV